MGEKEPLFLLIARLAEKDGAAPITTFEGCWERQIGAQWWVAINAHARPVKCSHGAEVPPFNCYVEFNGWPAGLFDPYGGIIAAGEAANEESFAAAVEAEIGAPA